MPSNAFSFLDVFIVIIRIGWNTTSFWFAFAFPWLLVIVTFSWSCVYISSLKIPLSFFKMGYLGCIVDWRTSLYIMNMLKYVIWNIFSSILYAILSLCSRCPLTSKLCEGSCNSSCLILFCVLLYVLEPINHSHDQWQRNLLLWFFHPSCVVCSLPFRSLINVQVKSICHLRAMISNLGEQLHNISR